MKDTSIISMNAENNHNSKSGTEKKEGEELVKREKIENSPFEIITLEKKHFIALGAYRVTDETEDKESLIKLIRDKDWDLLFNTVSVIADTVLKAKSES